MSLLSVNDLVIAFHHREGRTLAVNNVSLTLEPAQTLCIVGESGSGKSVLCNSILGLLPSPPARIEQGGIHFNDMDLLAMSPHRLRSLRGNRIAMVFQDPMTSLNPYLKIGTQLQEPLKLHRGISGKAATPLILEAMAEVGLTEPERLIRQYPHQLSGGMRQRVMIAMALSTRPDILIADEPTTALDVTVQAQILALLERIKREHNIAVIFVSHDLGVVADIADTILVMEKGRIVEQGTSEQIFNQTRHDYTRRLIASIPSSAKPLAYASELRKPENQLLGVEHVSITYRSKPASIGKAVNNVSLKIYRGETLGLVGESGSGKTTLGRSIMRFLHVDHGRIMLEQTDLVHARHKELQRLRPEFQMIFQDPYASLNPRMTVYDTLLEAIRIRHSGSSAGELHDELLRLMHDVELPAAQMRKYPHEFSGGQRQRIAIARAIALKPGLIIADEPVSALDVTIQAQILDLLLRLVSENNLTMLFISHDLSVVRYMSDRIAVMYRGEIVETGDTELIFSAPKHSYTRSLLSAIPGANLKNEAISTKTRA